MLRMHLSLGFWISGLVNNQFACRVLSFACELGRCANRGNLSRTTVLSPRRYFAPSESTRTLQTAAGIWKRGWDSLLVPCRLLHVFGIPCLVPIVSPEQRYPSPPRSSRREKRSHRPGSCGDLDKGRGEFCFPCASLRFLDFGSSCL